jgi:hypothetical protein
MLFKNIILACTIGILAIGCAKEGLQGIDQVEVETSSNIETPVRRVVESESHNTNEPRSCMKQCGQEARGTVFADCLENGGAREECGSSGRAWYRTCLEERCDESALQIDDCKTDCRINAKIEATQCMDSETDEKECRSARKESVQECITQCTSN